jgi:hypothetical protein
MSAPPTYEQAYQAGISRQMERKRWAEIRLALVMPLLSTPSKVIYTHMDTYNIHKKEKVALYGREL